jgi:ABC-type branched-subunit amino acid transport system substrate-binding protein
MIRAATRVVAALAALSLVAAACGDDDDDDGGESTEAPSEETTAGTEATGDTEATEDTEATGDTEATEGTEATEDTEGDGGDAAAGWTVNGEDCIDPDRINEPIEGTVRIGSSGPLSGGPAAAAFAPVIAGLETYIAYANENDLLPGYEIELSIGDDQYDPALTPGVISGELDAGAQLFTGMIGTPNNKAVRDTLNEECVPQLLAGSGDPAWGDVENYPWTTGGILPYDVEAKAYAEHIGTEFPDGATAAVYYVNNDAGVAFKDGFEEVAGEFGIEIVDEQTVEAPETAPPSAQVSSIAGNAPDVIVSFPLGAQCPVFLSEIANAKAANPDWDPRIYNTSTCASSLILETAGAAADGIYTSPNTGIVDLENEENHSIPGVAEYLATIEAAGLADTVPTSATGWLFGEVTLEILRQAAESPDGLTQASIIEAARNFEYSPSIVREGVVFKQAGLEDDDTMEDVQILQYDADTQTMTDVGELITTFRSS